MESWTDILPQICVKRRSRQKILLSLLLFYCIFPPCLVVSLAVDCSSARDPSSPSWERIPFLQVEDRCCIDMKHSYSYRFSAPTLVTDSSGTRRVCAYNWDDVDVAKVRNPQPGMVEGCSPNSGSHYHGQCSATCELQDDDVTWRCSCDDQSRCQSPTSGLTGWSITPVNNYTIQAKICPEGFYCPVGGDQIVVPEGYSTDTALGRGGSSLTYCPEAHFCDAGATSPSACPAGTTGGYGTSIRSDQCSGSCSGPAWFWREGRTYCVHSDEYTAFIICIICIPLVGFITPVVIYACRSWRRLGSAAKARAAERAENLRRWLEEHVERHRRMREDQIEQERCRKAEQEERDRIERYIMAEGDRIRAQQILCEGCENVCQARHQIRSDCVHRLHRDICTALIRSNTGGIASDRHPIFQDFRRELFSSIDSAFLASNSQPVIGDMVNLPDYFPPLDLHHYMCSSILAAATEWLTAVIEPHPANDPREVMSRFSLNVGLEISQFISTWSLVTGRTVFHADRVRVTKTGLSADTLQSNAPEAWRLCCQPLNLPSTPSVVPHPPPYVIDAVQVHPVHAMAHMEDKFQEVIKQTTISHSHEVPSPSKSDSSRPSGHIDGRDRDALEGFAHPPGGVARLDDISIAVKSIPTTREIAQSRLVRLCQP